MSERRRILEEFDLQKDFMQETVYPNIEKYRKGDALVRVCDQNGKALSGVKLHLRQTSHQFRFGANIFMLEEMENAEKNALYKKYFAETFNMATLPFYWNATEPEEGKTRYAKGSPRLYRRPPIDLCMEFCRENGIEPREHGLAYEQWFPDWLKGKETVAVKAALEKHFKELARLYGDQIPTIEVTNEMTWRKGKTPFYDDPEYVLWCFQTAEKYFPHNKLVVNEGSGKCWDDYGRATDSYSAYIEANLLKGARIDAIGFQHHGFFRREEEYDRSRLRYNPRQAYRRMDLYARFGKPLQITEVTFPAYSANEEDELIQAELLEKMYTLWFSHPAMEQIVYWNLVDGYAHLWNVDEKTLLNSLGDMTVGENYYYGGLFRFDFTPKPAYYRLKKLMDQVWHTELDVQTDENGYLRFRGFYGDYSLEKENGEKNTFTLSSDKQETEILAAL